MRLLPKLLIAASLLLVVPMTSNNQNNAEARDGYRRSAGYYEHYDHGYRYRHGGHWDYYSYPRGYYYSPQRYYYTPSYYNYRYHPRGRVRVGPVRIYWR